MQFNFGPNIFPMMKILNLFVLLTCLAILGCGADSQSAYKFTCGSSLTKSELTPFEAPIKQAYAPIEFKLLGKLSMAIFDANHRIKNYNVQFFENTRERLVVQVYGIWEPTEMDNAACAVLNFEDYQLPTETLVIFYQNEKNDAKTHIVAGVRKK